MRRTDRLYALVEELRSRAPRPVSRADLATTLEVTARTVERDILALQQAGVPIWSQRGRGGGYALDERWSLPPLNFDVTEALAIISALGAARTLPFAEAGRRAEHKILAAMRHDEAARAREIAGRLRLGDFGRRGARDIVAGVERAVVGRSVVEIGYRDRRGLVSTRAVEAHGLQITPDGSFLVAWCRLRDDVRAFRLDRIVSVRETGEAAPVRHIDGDRLVGGWGPPRGADHQTGSNPAYARAVATALAGATATARSGVSTHRVAGQAFLRVDEHDGSVVVDGHTIVLRTIGRDDLRELVESAWAGRAPKPAVSAHRRARALWAQQPTVTFDDVRKVVAALPGAVEGPIWGADPGFLVGTDKRTRFARFGPPEAGRPGNLLPPDDENTLVILRCERRPELLAARADRWFTTAHYGDPGQPGALITRLSEHRGPDDLAGIAELLVDAWREVAPPEVVARFVARAGRRGGRSHGT
ncbi:MAG TPA: WYL domain-containing protein [Acidimicrobiales bacterium]|nr:WYL domain-containing protein [Acidimicrobiales bacterium]